MCLAIFSQKPMNVNHFRMHKQKKRRSVCLRPAERFFHMQKPSFFVDTFLVRCYTFNRMYCVRTVMHQAYPKR